MTWGEFTEHVDGTLDGLAAAAERRGAGFALYRMAAHGGLACPHCPSRRGHRPRTRRRRAARLAALEMLALLAGQAQQIQAGSQRRSSGPKLPAKRKKSGPAAPIYQVKVGLRGAKPPIWRRLEVPADTSLADLHNIIQVAFGWENSHLHVFETAYGAFGVADRELGHRAEAPVTLEQVAPGTDDRLQYT
jgi:hypothetical protein